MFKSAGMLASLQEVGKTGPPPFQKGYTKLDLKASQLKTQIDGMTASQATLFGGNAGREVVLLGNAEASCTRSASNSEYLLLKLAVCIPVNP